MMNLSINLTLGSPGADSVLNSAVAPEDETVDSFSLKLADELSEQELTPSLLMDDTKAVDPALLEAIAARQKVAADTASTSTKDTRSWVADPLIGLPVAEDSEVELVDTLVEDKPWFDIIEKAKSYGPALQANKATLENTAESLSVLQDHALIGAADLAELPLVDAAILLADSQNANPAIAESVSEADVLTPVALNSQSADSELHAATMQSVTLLASEPTEKNALSTNTEQLSLNTESLPAEQDGGGPQMTAAVIADEATTQQDASLNKSSELAGKVEIHQPETAQNIAVATGVENQSGQALAKVPVAVVAEPGAEPEQGVAAELRINAGALSESAPHHTDSLAKTTQAMQQPNTVLNTIGNEQVAASQPTDIDPVQQAAALTETTAASIAASRTASPVQAGAEKAPASNAFAEHMKSVNQAQQQQQQQQQSGSEQQSGQGQAKVNNVEAMLTNPTTQPAATVTSFVQQLQQLQQPAETAGASHAVVQTVSHTATTHSMHSPLTTARPADLTSWQAPLALTEPAAAQQLKDRVMVQIQQKLQTAEVQLHPEDLGSIQIKLNLQQDQLSVQFVVQQSAAKEALEQQMPKLRDLLEQQGIALSEGQVEQRQSGNQQEQRQGRSGQTAGDETDLMVTQTVQMKVSDRMVDFYA